MNDIVIHRKHGRTRAEARVAGERMVVELKKELDLEFVWTGDVLRFQRPGITGELALDDEKIVLNIRLGSFLTPLKPGIERAIHEFFDECFGVA